MALMTMPDGKMVNFPDSMAPKDIWGIVEANYPGAYREAQAAQGVKPYDNFLQTGVKSIQNAAPAAVGSLVSTVQAGIEGAQNVLDPKVQPGLTPPLEVTPGATIEDLLSQPASPTIPVASGPFASILNNTLEAAGVKRGVSQYLAYEDLRAQLTRTKLDTQVAANAPDIAPGDWGSELLGGTIGALSEMAAPIAASLAVRSPAPIIAYGIMRGFGEGFNLAKNVGQGYENSLVVGTLYGAAEAVTEAIAGKVFLEGGKTLVRTVLKSSAVEGLTEGATEVIQALVDKVFIDPNMTLDAALERITKVAAIGVLSGGVISVGTHPFSRQGRQGQQNKQPATPEEATQEASAVASVLDAAPEDAPLMLPAPDHRIDDISKARVPPIDYTAIDAAVVANDQRAREAVQNTGQAETEALLAAARETVSPIGAFNLDELPSADAGKVRQRRLNVGIKDVEAPTSVEEMAQAKVPQPAIDAVIAVRKPFTTGEKPIVSTDVEKAAAGKNINVVDAGFKELAFRTVGSRNMNRMSQTQLGVLREKINSMPNMPTMSNIPVMDSASFTETQYEDALRGVKDKGLVNMQVLRDATGVKDAATLKVIRNALQDRGQIVEASKGRFKLSSTAGVERQTAPSDIPKGDTQVYTVSKRLPVSKVKVTKDGKSMGTFDNQTAARGKVKSIRDAEAKKGTAPSKVAIEPAGDAAYGVIENRYDKAGNLIGQVIVDTHRSKSSAQTKVDTLNTLTTKDTEVQKGKEAKKAKTPDPLTNTVKDVAASLNDTAKKRGLPLLGTRVKIVDAVATPDGQMVEGSFTGNIIRLTSKHLSPDMSVSEMTESLAGVMDHELVHALVGSGVLEKGGKAWKTLSRYVEKAKRPGTDGTYYEWAKRKYLDNKVPGYETKDDAVEEAIAEAFRAWASNKRNVAGQPATIFKQLVRWFKNLVDATPNGVFGAIESGAMVRDALTPPGSSQPRAETTKKMDAAVGSQNTQEFLQARAQAREDRKGRSGPKSVIGTDPTRAYENGDKADPGVISGLLDKLVKVTSGRGIFLQTYLPDPVEYLSKVAAMQEKATNMPSDTATAKAYSALIGETLSTFKKLNVTVQEWAESGQPYASPNEMIQDVVNGTVKMRLSSEVFGEGADNSGHPMNKDSGVHATNGTMLSNNDILRVVHDVYGKARSGLGTNSRDEYNAFHAHALMLSEDAGHALATEVLAQSAWRHYGPHLRRKDGSVPVKGDVDYLPARQKEFPEQKAYLLSKEILEADPGRSRIEEALSIEDEGAPSDAPRFSLKAPKIIRDELAKETKMRGDGRKFEDFFTSVTEGSDVHKPGNLNSYEPAFTMEQPAADFAAVRKTFSGNFDDHIMTSIPGFNEVQNVVGAAIVSTYSGTGASVLDIGASEGALAKAITNLSNGDVKTVSMDPNPAMVRTFENKPQVEGATVELAAFGEQGEEGKVAWTEKDGTDIKFFDPKGRTFDVVHEAMVFQFISNSRKPQLARVKQLMDPEGILVLEEKFANYADVWNTNEDAKDAYKRNYYTKEQLAQKKKEVLDNGGDAVEGMTGNMVSQQEIELFLSDHFENVVQFWDSGNFKGYVASDNVDALNRFVSNMQDTQSEYSTTSTPAGIKGQDVKWSQATPEDFKTLSIEGLEKPGWAVLTATREDIGSYEHPDNVAANEALQKEMESTGAIPVTGRYMGIEQGPSMLTFLGEQEALALARKLKQESILTSRGLLYTDGRVAPTVGEKFILGEEATKAEGVTVFPNGDTMSAIIDFDNVSPADAPSADKLSYPKLDKRTPGSKTYGKTNISPGALVVQPGAAEVRFTAKREGNKHFAGPNVTEQLRRVRAAEDGAMLIYMRPRDFVAIAGRGENPEQATYNQLVRDGYKFDIMPSMTTKGYAGTLRVSESDSVAIARAMDGVAGSIPVVIYPESKQPVGMVNVLEGNKQKVLWPSEGRQEKFSYAKYSVSKPYEMTRPFGERIPPETNDKFNIFNQKAEGPLGKTIQKAGRSDKPLPVIGSVLDARIKLEDRMLSVRLLLQDLLDTGGTIAADANTYIKEQLANARAVFRISENDKTLYHPLQEAVIATEKTDHPVTMEDLNTYVYARHAGEANRFLRSRGSKEKDPSGMSDQEAEDILTKMAADGTLPTLKSLASFNDAIIADTNRVELEAGLITQKTIDASPYEFYVPLRGAEGEAIDVKDLHGRGTTRSRTGKGFSVGGKEHRARTGRRTKAQNIVAHTILQNVESIIRAEKNGVAVAFAKMVNDNPGIPGVKILTKTPTRMVSGANGMIREMGDPQYRQKEDIFTAKVDGQEIVMQIEDPRIQQAMKFNTVKEASMLTQAMAKLNRFLSTMYTTSNPAFMVRNAIKDLQTAGILSLQYDIEGFTKDVVLGTPKALAGVSEVLRKGTWTSEAARYFREMQEAGGTSEFLGIHTIETRVIEMQRRASRMGLKPPIRQALAVTQSVWGLIDTTTKTAENGVRLSTYIAARKAGASIENAAYMAKNITVNFNKGGEWKAAANSWYLFYGASIGGATNIVRGLRSKKVQLMLGGVIAAGAMLDMLNRLMANDDDNNGINDYDDIPDYVLESNWVLMDPMGISERLGGPKGYFKIPMSPGYNVFSNLGRNLSNVMSGSPVHNPAKSASSILMTAVSGFNPVGGTNSILNFLAPTILDPVVDLATNKDFTGSSIVPKRVSFGAPIPESQKFWANTGDVPKWTADQINSITGGNAARKGAVDVSPETLQYLYDYFTGGTGKFVAQVSNLGYKGVTGSFSDVRVNEVPFAGDFYGLVDSRGTSEVYYGTRDQVRVVEAELKLAEDTGNAEMYRATRDKNPLFASLIPLFKNAERQLSAIRRQMRAIEASTTMTEERQKNETQRLRDLQDDIRSRVNKRYLALRDK